MSDGDLNSPEGAGQPPRFASDSEFGGEGQRSGWHVAGQRHRHERLIRDVDVQRDAEA